LPGIKLILDFVPNHTSNESIWFQKSEQGDPYYKDFYVWHPGKINNETGEREPPSNWNSLFRYSAWEWSEIRQEYYLHQCIIQQPDLNYRNPNVVKEMKDVLTFWLNKGIDGFRIDAIPYIFETVNDDGSYPDEPASGLTNDTTSIDYTNRMYTKDLSETYDMVYQWRELMDNYKKEHGGSTRILMTEAYASLESKLEYYGDSFGRRGAEIPFNFELIDNINVDSTPQDYKDNIDLWIDNMPKADDYVPNWVVGNHDNHRVVNRFGLNRGDAINIMVQTLPGIAITYNGEELVMTDQWISWNNTVDPLACQQDPDNYNRLSRDPARTPFQWDDSRQAGFSTANKTWLPVADNYKSVNVKKERADPNSHLNVFKRLTQMRKSKKVLQEGNLESLADRNLLIYKREIPGAQLFVVLNFGTADQGIRLSDYFGTYKSLVIASVVSSNSGIRRG
jgi:alpha-glucosidase